MGRFAIGYGTLRYWVWDASLLDMGRPAGYWVWDASLLDIGDGLLAMGRFAIGYGTLRYWIWDASLLDIGRFAIGYWTPYGLLGMGRPAGYWLLDALRAMG